MITVKVKTIHKTTEIFETQNYVVCNAKECHPDILDVKVYVGTKCIKHVKRHFQWFYKKFLYKPVQQELKPDMENKNVNM